MSQASFRPNQLIRGLALILCWVSESDLAWELLTAVGLEALDTTIRTSEEAESASALPSLAVIPRIR